MSTITTFIQHSIRHSSHCNKTRKIHERQIGKEDIKLCLFEDMNGYLENHKDYPNKTPRTNK